MKPREIVPTEEISRIVCVVNVMVFAARVVIVKRSVVIDNITRRKRQNDCFLTTQNHIIERLLFNNTFSWDGYYINDAASDFVRYRISSYFVSHDYDDVAIIMFVPTYVLKTIELFNKRNAKHNL